MESLFGELANEPFFIIGVAAAVLLSIWAVIKKLVNVALIALACFAGLVAYWHFTGQEPPPKAKAIQERLLESTKNAQEKLREGVEEARDDLVDDAAHKAVQEAKANLPK